MLPAFGFCHKLAVQRSISSSACQEHIQHSAMTNVVLRSNSVGIVTKKTIATIPHLLAQVRQMGTKTRRNITPMRVSNIGTTPLAWYFHV